MRSSRPLYYCDGSARLNGNWVDGTALHEIGPHHEDGFRQLAKVRVASSNLVLRVNLTLC
jgi:hypothetical protein